ncbi:MAG TPA: imidazole glycerol phosphate synthase subunit HisH [Balneolaceae bacterium]|nr:imidazole glycerol phosphate synthase subunit HisH [Balneolaceae bacterium]
MIAIINYKAGNLASVSNALDRLSAEFIITNKIDELESADGIIFPGVGHAQAAMQSLRENELDAFLKKTTKPLLGICLGMQLLFESSDEGGGTGGLARIPGRLKKFDSSTEKVPHMGWNNCHTLADHPIMDGLSEGDYFYFVHSFYAPVNDFTVASCNYITDFAAVAARDNVIGTQFHPEKSGDAGHQLLRNFLDIVD